MQCTHGLIFIFGAMIQLAVFLFPLIVLQLKPTLSVQGQIKSTILPSDNCFTSCPVQDHDVLQQIREKIAASLHSLGLQQKPECEGGLWTSVYSLPEYE